MVFVLKQESLPDAYAVNFEYPEETRGLLYPPVEEVAPGDFVIQPVEAYARDKTVTTAFRHDPDLHLKLEALCEEFRLNKGEMVRRLVYFAVGELLEAGMSFEPAFDREGKVAQPPQGGEPKRLLSAPSRQATAPEAA